MTSGTNRVYRRVAVWLAAIVVPALLVAACGGSTTLPDTTSAGGDLTVEPAPTVDPVEPTAVPADSGDDTEPTPDTTATDDGDQATATPEPTESATMAPEADLDLQPAEFRTDNIVAISESGRYAYSGTTSAYNSQTSCDAAKAETLAFVAIDDAVDGEVNPYAAGFVQTGDIRQLLIGDDGRAIAVLSCGGFEDATVWMQQVRLTPDGPVADIGDVIPLGAEGESDPFLLRWVDDSTIELRVVIEVDPDDFETWIVERRQVSVETGEVVATEQFGYFDDDDAFASGGAFVTAEGFTYRAIPDPNGAVGCEGFGVARTLELDDGSGVRSAFDGPDRTFSIVEELHVSDDGYIAWYSGCEGFVSAYVGRVQDDGTIADAHLIDTYSLQGRVDDFADYYFYRLTADGHLAAVGQAYAPDTDESTPAFLRYDLATDPNFVNTAEPPVDIDEAPLFDAIEAGGTWHVGETLAQDRACGGRTLYGRVDGGHVRAFPAGIELDAIVDVDLADTRTIEYDDSDDYVSRTVVVQTECPAEYDGRRVWFGIESDRVVWGLVFQQADLGEVADVLSVRDVVEPGTDFVEYSVVQVELLDGSVVEVELDALPQ